MAILRQFSDIVAFFNDHIATLENKTKTVKSTYTVNNGYFVVQDSSIVSTSKIFVQIFRTTGIWAGYSAYPRIDTNGEVNVYVRKYDESLPANNSTLEASVMIVN